MKTKSNLIASFVFFIALSACGEREKQETAPVKESQGEQAEISMDNSNVSFTEENTERFWINYLELKNALVVSKADQSQKVAANMAKGLPEESELHAIAERLANTENLSEQRELFAELTESSEALLKDGISNGKLYKQYCPMAFDNQGGFWYSDLEEIRNPYFGAQMLKCGKVEEIIMPRG